MEHTLLTFSYSFKSMCTLILISDKKAYFKSTNIALKFNLNYLIMINQLYFS